MPDIDRGILPGQKPLKLNIPDLPIWDIGIPTHIPVATNDYYFAILEGKPGDTLEWHTHMPSVYQVNYNIEGHARWRYKDNEGEEKVVEAGPNELVFLPGGMENQLEIIGDSPNKHVSVYSNQPVIRVEQLLGLEQSGYDPSADEVFPAGVNYDNIRDTILHIKEDAVVY